MGWPLSQEYNEAVQNPRTSFADPDLRAGEVVCGPLGLPMPRSGNFADVYQVRSPDGRTWALKCFTRPATGLGDRYRPIDEHLRAARLPFSVGFQFLDQGVRIRGAWFPAVKMEWVEGLTLNQFVRDNADRPDHLKALLGMWVRLCKRLRDAKIAHADLQHGNVLLVPGATANRLKLRLIDYDGMWVPALADKPSGEVGHPAYQHPIRLRDRLYTADVDRFPHLVIGCALRALAVAGKSLWDRFDNGDNMLFREADLADPGGSAVFRALWELDDPTVTNLVALLVLSARQPIHKTPWLDVVLDGERTAPVSDAVLARAADVLGVERRAVREAAPVAQLYSVPEEANEFSEMGAGASLRAARPNKPRSVMPFVAAGGLVLAAAAVIVAVIAIRGNRPDPTPPDPAPGPVVKGTEPTPKPGIVETKWVAVAPGQLARRPKSIVTGIDVAPPGSGVVRTYPVAGAAGLGVWLLPDGARAVVASKAGLGVLDLDAGRVQPLPKGGTDLVAAAVGPDGKYALAAGRDRTVRCLDLGTGELVWTHKFPGPVGCLAVTPDGRRAAATWDRVGYTEWELKDGREVRRHESLQAAHLAFTPDALHALAAGDAGVELWALDDARVTPLAPDVRVSAVGVSPDGRLGFAVGPELRVWELPGGTPRPDRTAPVKPELTSVGSTPDGALLVGTAAGEVGILGPDQTTATLSPDIGGPARIVGIAVTGDGQHALVATEPGNVALARIADLVRPAGSPRFVPTAGCLEWAGSVPVAAEFTRFAADVDGKRFLAASAQRIDVYDADKFQKIDGFRVAGGPIVGAGFGPGDSVIVCEAEGDTFRTGAHPLTKGQPGPAFALEGAEPGRVSRITPVKDHDWVVASTAAAGDVLFDPATGKPVEGWPAPRVGDPAVAAASPNGRRLAVGTTVDPVRIWATDTKAVERTCEASVGIQALAFTPDGTRLVGLWPQGRLRVWDALTGRFLKEVDHGHPGPFAELTVIAEDLAALGPAPNRVLLNLDTGKGLNTGTGPDPLAGRGLVVPPRGWVLAADRDDRLVAWKVIARAAADLPEKVPRPSPWADVALLRDAPASPPVGLAFDPDGKTLVIATEDGRIARFTADRLALKEEVVAREAPLAAVARAGNTLFTLNRQGVVTMRDAETFKRAEKDAEFKSSAPTGAIPVLFAVDPAGDWFLVGTDKGRLTDVKSRLASAPTIPRGAFGKPLTQFALSADGGFAVARWADTMLAVWHPRHSTMFRMLPDPDPPVPSAPDALAVSPGGDLAVLGYGDGRVAMWDTARREVIDTKDVYPPVGTDPAIRAVTFLPKESRFLTVGRDGRVILWDPRGFERVKEYSGPAGPWKVAVSPDAKTVIMQQPGYVQRLDLP